MIKMPTFKRCAWLMMSLLSGGPTLAGSFAVSPIRVELSMGTRTGVLSLRNETDVETLVQVRAVQWSQLADADQLDDTNDLLVTPPIFKLPARGEQILRVAIRREVDPALELSYRLLIQEVPRVAAVDKPQLTVALRISLPVFVAAVVRAQPDLQWLAGWQPDGSVRIEAQNLGKAHMQITDFDLQIGAVSAPGASGSKYLLPGSRASWIVKAPSNVDHNAPITLRGHSDHGNIEARIALAGR